MLSDVFSILGGLISKLIDFFIEDKRRKNEKREKHFQEIKEQCLKPLRDGLLRLRGEFEFEESIRMPIFRLMETILEGDIHWWDNYSLKIWCDKTLFEDLRNHFPDLAKNLEEVEKRIRYNYPEFYKNILSLLKEIYSCKELNDLSNQIVLHVGNYPKLPYDTVFLVALGYDKGCWPNYYNFLKEKMGKLDLIYE
ncbi:MAG: hypothetical protein ACP5KW_11690, partial [Thermoproteota archaeon]